MYKAPSYYNPQEQVGGYEEEYEVIAAGVNACLSIIFEWITLMH